MQEAEGGVGHVGEHVVAGLMVTAVLRCSRHSCLYAREPLCLVSAKGKEDQRPRRSYRELAGLAASGEVKTESHKEKEGRDRAREREEFVNRKADI